jgi:hypothetical protein
MQGAHRPSFSISSYNVSVNRCYNGRCSMAGKLLTGKQASKQIHSFMALLFQHLDHWAYKWVYSHVPHRRYTVRPGRSWPACISSQQPHPTMGFGHHACCRSDSNICVHGNPLQHYQLCNRLAIGICCASTAQDLEHPVAFVNIMYNLHR